jgi:hypothetical protein
MMRAQFYFPDDTYTKLSHLAAIRKASLAQIVRAYVEEGIERDTQTSKGNAHVLRGLAERAEKEGWRSTGVGDGSVNHNKYVSKAYLLNNWG